jgi:predicted HTH domain antitoxin
LGAADAQEAPSSFLLSTAAVAATCGASRETPLDRYTPNRCTLGPHGDGLFEHGGRGPERNLGFAMATVTLELPEDVFSALRRSPQEFARELRLAAAIHWYQRGQVSQEKAAQIAGLDRTDFLLALSREGVDAFVVDFDDLERELARG